MEAANRGADRAGIKTIGLNISLPFEQSPNKYITPELNFEFHYFFMRKLWFLYHAKAIVVFPGGFGTLEVVGGKQETKDYILKDFEPYLQGAFNFNKLKDHGLISPEDLDLFHFFKDIDDGINYLKPRLEELIEKVNNGIFSV